MTITSFKTGATYMGRFICDADSIFTRTVTKRTAKTVWLKDSRGTVKSYRVKEYVALGSYSMAPGLHADREVAA